MGAQPACFFLNSKTPTSDGVSPATVKGSLRRPDAAVGVALADGVGNVPGLSLPDSQVGKMNASCESMLVLLVICTRSAGSRAL